MTQQVIDNRPLFGGLTHAEARRRLRSYGHNQARCRHASGLALLLRQFKGPLTWLMLAAALVSFLLNQVDDAIMITVLLGLSVLIGFVQELRSERALLTLQSQGSPRAIVRRESSEHEISALTVVPGDVLVLRAGQAVAADARLLQADGLELSEHDLTGESHAVPKQVGVVPVSSPLTQRNDCVFGGTIVESGSGLAEVFATADDTVLARLGQCAADKRSSQTLLEQQLSDVSRTLVVGSTGVVALVAVSDLLWGRSWSDVFVMGVSLAVAAVPEGLPTIVTLGLAKGARHMAKRHVLVRELDAIESVGSTTVICVGKSGVLTTGKVQVRALIAEDPKALLRAALLSSEGSRQPAGPSTAHQLAITERAQEEGVDCEEIERIRHEGVDNAIHQHGLACWSPPDGAAYATGSIDALRAIGVGVSPQTETEVNSLQAQGHEVLAVAAWHGEPTRDAHLLGLLGLSEPPRAGIREALARARVAGIRIIVSTGDELQAAHAVAREVGALRAQDRAVDVVYASATPERKLELVRQLHQRGEVVAMTGESANNALALREADVAFSLKESGDAARAASKMVLLDDDFAHVMSAIKLGRGIYANIRKAIVYLMAGNVAELIVMLLASVAGLPAPLLPVQLLWINMVTDGLPALALVMDPIGDDVLLHPPRGRAARLLGKDQWRTIAAIGALQSMVCLGVFAWGNRVYGIAAARNLVFTSFVFLEVLWAMVAKDAHRPCWTFGLRANLGLFAVVAGSIGLQVAVVHLPFGHVLYGEHMPTLRDFGWPLLLACAVTLALEGTKRIGRRMQRTRHSRHTQAEIFGCGESQP